MRKNCDNFAAIVKLTNLILTPYKVQQNAPFIVRKQEGNKKTVKSI